MGSFFSLSQQIFQLLGTFPDMEISIHYGKEGSKDRSILLARTGSLPTAASAFMFVYIMYLLR